jgi:hypothetical protein
VEQMMEWEFLWEKWQQYYFFHHRSHMTRLDILIKLDIWVLFYTSTTMYAFHSHNLFKVQINEENHKNLSG